ncbi:MAG: flavin reductase family protein [Bacteroidia bacterium]|nr:flavin reductase family protein [Bacteroidia bacterium]
MRTVDPGQVPIPELHQILVGTVAPRPIALVSTISEDGIPNLAPYSFFNVFGSNPATLVFSSVRQVRDGSKKDTLSNVEAVGECVVHVVSHEIVWQMAISSQDYPKDVNEFSKAGFTPLPSDLVKPLRVKESPVHFECTVREIYPLGHEGGGGNLVICNIQRIHVSEEIFSEDGKIDPQKLDLMGRMGRAFYARAKGENVFPLYMPRKPIGKGFDQLPEHIKNSSVLTGNDLSRFAYLAEFPASNSDINSDPEVMNALAGNVQDRELRLHTYAKELIQKDEIEKAWQVLNVDY